MHNVDDFEDDLTKEVRTQLHQTAIYKRFAKERKRVSKLADDRVSAGGTYSDPDLLKQAERLEALGAAVLEKAREMREGNEM